MKLVRRILLGVVAAYAAVLVALYVIISMPPGRFANLIARIPSSETPGGPVFEYVLPLEPIFKTARAGKLQLGDVAPDLNLKLVHGDEHVHLASFRDQRPVVLIFGSYT
jgi:hypothetical protein